MNLTDRRILITGGGSGIGQVLARALAPTNRVVIAGRELAKLEVVPGVEAVPLDVTSEEQARQAIAWVQEHIGGLDVLVNCAGVLSGGAFDERTGFEEVEVNLIGAVRMTRMALPMLRRSEDGAVVFLSSALALVAVPRMAVYAATKAAVHSLARSLRSELEGEVKVFDVLPPWVDTGLADGVRGQKLAPERVAANVIRGLERDKLETRVGRVKALALLRRVSQSWADSVGGRSGVIE